MTITTNDVLATPLPWRKITTQHKAMGARVIRKTVTLGANTVNSTVLNLQYGPGSIDRIIGVMINQQGAEPGTLTIEDIAGFRADFIAKAQIGTLWFNIGTGTDIADIVVSWSGAAGTTLNFEFYNFEIPVAQLGLE